MTRTTRFTRLTSALVALALAAAFAVGCSSQPESTPAEKPEASSAAKYPVTITDDANRTVVVKARPERIVSLAPANTEILFAIGAGERVVGVTSYDDFPPDVEAIEKVGDFAGPNLEAVAAADPDLVVATTGVQADTITKLEELGATVIALDPQTLEGLYAGINELGQATGEIDGAQTVVSEMKSGVADVREAVAGRPPVKVFVEIGQNPLFTVGKGTLIDELVRVAGGKNIVAESGYVPYSTEQLVNSDPQVYLATKGTMSDPDALKSRPGYDSIAAVKNGRVVILDDNLVTRPGPRAVLGLKQIAEGLYPEAFEK